MKKSRQLQRKNKMENKEIVLETDIFAEKGYLYPTGRTEDGRLVILKIKAGRKKK